MNKQSSSSKEPQEQVTSSIKWDEDYVLMMLNYGGWEEVEEGTLLDLLKEKARIIKKGTRVASNLMIVKIVG
ncbi:MAG: hypothetical protein Unbinned2691contig1000_26 [Prokaryotic dsDNA virus sp.]|nr:MAG: hypothetical protein Unbinned2691contig1000_26 [Prokaryotic dsDNA virus sp.]